MAEYRGVGSVARQITKKYRGVGGVARQITKRYRGVNNVARLVFGNLFTYKKFYDTGNSDVVTFETYAIDIVDGVLTMSATATATWGNNMPGRTLRLIIYGDLAGKSISFEYVSTGYSAGYSTIEYQEMDGASAKVYSEQLSGGSGSVSRKISSDTDHINFGFWFGSDAEEAGTRRASLIISNLKIGGVSVF